jgi:hypothetical protein
MTALLGERGHFMKILNRMLAAAVAAAATFAMASPASAQATRTWVSGVGDDVNPCSRTAPCKTFAGAISKTAAGGEINCLDPGGFGAVTITKAMTIACPYTEGGALAGGNGIVVNAGAADVVFLRGLDIFGVNPPTNGVRFIAGAALHIQDSVIRRFNAVNSQGISFQPSGSSELYLTNVTIAENGNGATGGGILIQPTGAAGSARVVMRNVRVDNNANKGLAVNTTGATGAGSVSVVADECSFSGNDNGVQVLTPSGTLQTGVMITNCVVANNAGIGLHTTGSTALMRVGFTTITGNGTGVSAVNGSTMSSYGNNRNIGNPTVGAANNGTFSGAVIPTQ